jgi:hypothetical protein
MRRRWYRLAAHNFALVSAAAIWLACSGGTEPVPPATTGAVEVTTATGGVDLDTDGYMLFLDGVEVQPIGPSATTTLDQLTASAHVVGLAGVAGNCQVEGSNPRGVTVTAGGTAAAAFAVACVQVPPDAGTIGVSVATAGADLDPDGYAVTLDAAGPWPVAVNGSISIPNVTAGAHQLALTGVAANCAVAGPQPQSVTVPAGGTVQSGFAVDCAALTGSLAVTVTGLPAGTDAAVTVTGPDGYQAAVAATMTLDGLAPGQYTVSAGTVTSGQDAYTSTPSSRTVDLAAGETSAVTVTYVAEPRPSLDLDIAGLYLTQSVQTFTSDVPLVAGRDALLRVFVRANEANTVTPAVRVRLYQSGSVVQTWTIAAPGASTPTAVDEGTLRSSWNVSVPGSLIGAGLEVLAEVDPAGSIAEADETDNSFPVSGTPALVTVRDEAPVSITLVPVLQSANGLQGRVSDANKAEYLDLIRRIYPIPGYDAVVHSVFTTAGPLQGNDANGAWGTLLGELDALRIAEGTGRPYYGVVQLDYSGGQTARSITGVPTAVGFDRVTERARMAAHELGHIWGRDHAPCGNAQALDPAYPYPNGQIGRYGYDVLAGVPKDVTTPDVMGLCQGPWISDYTYVGVMNFRAAAPASAGLVTAAARPTLLVWGRVEDGRAVLEPAFQVVTRPVLPSRPGAWSLEGATAEGATAFRVSFDPMPAADGERAAGHFAFAVPLDPAVAGRLESIRLSGPAGSATVARGASPAVMLRDPATGQVLSIVRGRDVGVTAPVGELDQVRSDGVGSVR